MSERSGLLAPLFWGLVAGCSGGAKNPPARTSDSAPAAASPAPVPGTWQVRHDGIGPLRIGATTAELATALGYRLARADSLDPRCDYLRDPTIIPGVWFMVVEGRIARLDVDSAGPATAEGVRVGDDTAKVLSTYSTRVAATPHKYTDGQYFTVTPAAPADSSFRIIFETDGGRITRYRAGRLPEVGWVESCS